MRRTLGIDLGTNSIGWAIRLENDRLDNQIIDKGVLLFDKGVATEKGNEFPKVQKRTESRGKRRNYQAEKYRKFELVEFLINKNMCPLSIKELNEWKKYTKGKKRKYPQSKEFVNWLRFDFNGDGKPDFHLFNKNKFESYYVFRALAIDENYKSVFDNNPEILGRVFYQLVQRRGFKGRDEEEAKTMLTGSTKTGTPGRDEIEDYINKYKSLGAALYHFQKEKQGRIRQRYNLRKDYESELKLICNIHNISNSDYDKLVKAIIWQRPLRTQKGLVGLCTFEKNKKRVALSHPLYQEYKTWVFINNLKIVAPPGINQAEYLQSKIYPLFYRKSDFEISNIIKQTQKDGATINSKYSKGKLLKTKVVSLGNFYDFENLLGQNWKEKYNFNNIYNREPNQKKKQNHQYSIDDIWHVLKTFDSKEKIEEWAHTKLGLDIESSKKLSDIKLVSGYATLSLSAVKKILPYLQKGIKYSTAVYLANIQKVLGENKVSKEFIEYFINEIEVINVDVYRTKLLNNVCNSIIKAHLEEDDRYFIENNRPLDDCEIDLVKQKLKIAYGEKSWSKLTDEERNKNINYVSNHFKNFLTRHITDKKDIFLKQPRFHQELFNSLQEIYDIPHENIKFLWHPSEQDKYPNALTHQHFTLNGKSLYIEESKIDSFTSKFPDAKREITSLKLLGSPEPISKGFKNPMALKTLHKLKKLLNYLLQINKVDEDTRIVVEIARDGSLNDSNMRAAITTFQKEREKENIAYQKIISEINKECNTNFDVDNKKLIQKVRLWEEQNRKCLYTGKTINMCDLLDGNKYDLEHTIPASMSFDSELKNLTVADTDFNRNYKQKQIPYQLSNYDEILPRISFMKDKIDELEFNLKNNLRQAKAISDKSKKDLVIQKRHIIKFKLQYWKSKYNTFTIEEFNPKWRNSQLRDTQIITKYALPYLNTVFNYVSVQKGKTVNDFKNIYKVLIDDKKDRSKHSHHAIDAAILTLIPTNYHREKILEKYFKAQEEKRKYHTIPNGWENFKASYIINIEKEILANNLEDNRILTPTFKKSRVRGKIVKNKDGTTRWQSGDSIRGQLHTDSFYGAIKQPVKDNNNKIKFDAQGKMILEDNINMVIRKPFVYKKNADSPGFKSLDEIEKVIVDKALLKQIKLQINNKDFKEMMEKGIWMLNKKGEKVNKIRRIRCFEDANIKFDSAIDIHEHTFKSNKLYKQSTYSKNAKGSTQYCIFYEKHLKNKIYRKIRPVSLFELSKLKLKSIEQIRSIEGYNTINSINSKNGIELPIKSILSIGQKVIFYKEKKEELKELSKTNLLERVYKIYQFESDRIKFKQHIIAGKLTDIKKNHGEESALNFENCPALYRIRQSNWNFVIENIDFTVSIDGEIKWL